MKLHVTYLELHEATWNHMELMQLLEITWNYVQLHAITCVYMELHVTS